MSMSPSTPAPGETLRPYPGALSRLPAKPNPPRARIWALPLPGPTPQGQEQAGRVAAGAGPAGLPGWLCGTALPAGKKENGKILYECNVCSRAGQLSSLKVSASGPQGSRWASFGDPFPSCFRIKDLGQGNSSSASRALPVTLAGPFGPAVFASVGGSSPHKDCP